MVDFLRALSIVLLLGMFYLAFKNKKFKRFLLIESVLIIVFIIGRQMYTSNLNTKPNLRAPLIRIISFSRRSSPRWIVRIKAAVSG